MGGIGGRTVRGLAFHICEPRLILGLARVICEHEYKFASNVVLSDSCQEGFSSGSPVFLHEQKPTICKDECKIVKCKGSVQIEDISVM